MSSCNRYGDGVDRELHAVGCCTCALYVTRPPQKQLTIAEAEHLLGLFGFHLEQQPDGRYVGVDPQRGLQTPHGSCLSTAHAADDLASLVVRCRCTHQLAGPMTISEATTILAGLGFELKQRGHRTFGRQWWATSQELAVATGEWGYLKDVVSAAKSYLAVSGHTTRQRDLPEILAQVPRDLDPKERVRRIADGTRQSGPRGAVRQVAEAEQPTLPDKPLQMGLGLDATPKVATPTKKPWPTTREARRQRRRK